MLKRDVVRAGWRAGLALFGALSSARPAHAITYYVDSRAGDDAAAGTSSRTAWRSFANLESHHFLPNDSILFARGSSYTGGATFTSSGAPGRPIVFASYGAGQAPAFSNPSWGVLNGNIFHVKGSWVVIDGLYFHDNANPPSPDHRNKNVQKMGAVYLAIGADHDIVRNCEFYHSPVGIKVKGSWDLITHNDLHDAPLPMGRTWGAIAIMIVSPHNEISYNRITNYGYYGGAYGSDGGAIELDGVDEAFDGRDIVIHHNVSIGNHGFLELAGHVTDSITVAYNLSDDVDKFVGGGTMKHTTILNNTVIRTREPNIDRYVFWTFYPEGTTLVVRNNIFVLGPGLQVFAPIDRTPGHHRTGVGEQPHDHNLYFVPTGRSIDPVGIEPGPGDILADPLFVDAVHEDFRLQKESPAIDAGADVGGAWDLDHHPVPAGRAPDIGAYETETREDLTSPANTVGRPISPAALLRTVPAGRRKDCP